MQEIKNRRISKELIKQIANLIQQRYASLNSKFLQYQNFNGEINNDKIIVRSKPTISFRVSTNNVREEKEDINWFIETLNNKSKEIESIHIHYFAFYKQASTDSVDCEESLSITLFEDSVELNKSVHNAESQFEEMINEILRILLTAPERYDATIRFRKTKENIPSLVIALIIGLIITITAFIAFKINNSDSFIVKFIISPYFAPMMLIYSFLLGLVIPGKNHSLYKVFQIRQKYTGYNSKTHSASYVNDIQDFKNKCEVEIGKNNNCGIIRQQIESNYKKSLKLFWILLLIFALICILFALI